MSCPSSPSGGRHEHHDGLTRRDMPRLVHRARRGARVRVVGPRRDVHPLGSLGRSSPTPQGHRAPLEAPQPHEPVEIGLSTCTRPDGIEAESPIVRLNGVELSIAQAVALAERLQSLVADYRAAGGVE